MDARNKSKLLLIQSDTFNKSVADALWSGFFTKHFEIKSFKFVDHSSFNNIMNIYIFFWNYLD